MWACKCDAGQPVVQIGYFIFPERDQVTRSPDLATMRLTLQSEEARGYEVPSYRLVPGAFGANTVRFVNTGNQPAPVTFANRIVQLVLGTDGSPLGAALGAAGYGLPGPAKVEPGAEISCAMTKYTPLVGEADRMLLLISQY